MASEHPITTAEWLRRSSLGRLYLLEAIMDANHCVEAMCADWRSEHCRCGIEFQDIINGE